MEVHVRSADAYRLMHEGALAFTKAELQGIRVDVDYVEKKMEELTKTISLKEQEFKKTNVYRHWAHSVKGRLNINSNTQLSHFLYNVKKVNVERTTTSGQGSTDDEALQSMGIPELSLLIDIRKLKKVRDTYLSAFAREQVNGYVHPFFNLHLVVTYRSSSDSPNFQNIPKRDTETKNLVRKALYPRPGHQLIEADYSKLEVCIAACYHKDPTMLAYLHDPTSDMHSDMAKQIFMINDYDEKKHGVLRQAAKNGFVFAQFYGDYYVNCSYNLACDWGKLPQGKWSKKDGIPIEDITIGEYMINNGINSYESFERHIQKIEGDFWNNRFPEYNAWRVRWYETYMKYGYIDMYTGFRCHGPMSRNDSINYPIQGAAFHCLLWSFIQITNILSERGMDSKLVWQIHDSMILDVHPNELEEVTAIIRQVTCVDLPKYWNWIIVPLDIKIDVCAVDGSWADKVY